MRYREAKMAAKKAVAAAKAAHYDHVYKQLDTRNGERAVYCLAKARRLKAEDVEKFYGVHDGKGKLLMGHNP